MSTESFFAFNVAFRNMVDSFEESGKLSLILQICVLTFDAVLHDGVPAEYYRAPPEPARVVVQSLPGFLMESFHILLSHVRRN
jgi:hypothetical protein